MKGGDRGWKSTINKEGCLYASCYCEENIYQLGKQILIHNEHDILANQDKLFVLFISNINQQTLIWKQRNSPAPDDPVCWDYHVILCCRNNDLNEENNLIFDFDTTLPFPVPLSRYIKEAFRPDLQVPVRFRQTIRIVPLQQFLDYFASDRSHMAESKALAPSWPPIVGEKARSIMNLMKYVNMSSSSSEEDINLGQVYSFHQFIQWSTSTIIDV